MLFQGRGKAELSEDNQYPILDCFVTPASSRFSHQYPQVGMSSAINLMYDCS